MMAPMTRGRWYLHKTMTTAPGVIIALLLWSYLDKTAWPPWLFGFADTAITAVPLAFYLSGPTTYRAYLRWFDKQESSRRPA